MFLVLHQGGKNGDMVKSPDDRIPAKITQLVPVVEQISKGLSFAVKCGYQSVFHPRARVWVVARWGNVMLSMGVRVGESAAGALDREQ